MIKVNQDIYLDLIKQEDANRLSYLGNDQEISKNMSDQFPYPYTLEEAKKWIAHSHTVRGTGEECHFAIYIDKQYAGGIGREQKSPNGRYKHDFHVGYRLGREYRGKGYMTVILQKFSDHLFQSIPLCHRQYSGVYGWNPASRRVMEKCGFVLEAEFKESVVRDAVFYDEWILGRLRK